MTANLFLLLAQMALPGTQPESAPTLRIDLSAIPAPTLQRLVLTEKPLFGGGDLVGGGHSYLKDYGVTAAAMLGTDLLLFSAAGLIMAKWEGQKGLTLASPITNETVDLLAIAAVVNSAVSSYLGVKALETVCHTRTERREWWAFGSSAVVKLLAFSVAAIAVWSPENSRSLALTGVALNTLGAPIAAIEAYHRTGPSGPAGRSR